MQRGSGQRGSVMPLVAICLAALMGFAGLGVDVGYWEYQQRQQQSAADAAALAGAQQLNYSACVSSSAAQTAAKTDSSRNGFTDGSNSVAVTVNTPPTSGPFSGNSCAVAVSITSSKVPVFFARLFGFSSVAETTQAVAQLADANGCIYMLAPNQNTNFQAANIQASTCSIYINGTANFNGATVNAAAIGEVNSSGSNNAGTFSAATPAPMQPVADPCAEIAGCAYLTANPPSTSPCIATYNFVGAMQPGCYNNLNLNGATVTLAPGLYVLAGSSNLNMATITGTGVTLYVPAGATTNFNKVSGVSITPPTTGNYVGVSYYQVANNSSTVNFNGSSTISGLIYAPSAMMNYNGSTGQYTILVAAYSNLNMSSGEDFGAPASGQALIKKAVLAQ
jgi:Putative Flp pilus-assembly TadE/G-like